MKVYFDYQGEPTDLPSGSEMVSEPLEREPYKVKITLPAKWVEGPAQKLLDYYCTTYNKKFPEKVMNAADMKLSCRGTEVPLDAEVGKYIEEHNDVLIQHKTQRKVEKVVEGSLLCTNYGCGKRYLPEENGAEACHYHLKPPVFHDVYKYWSCCPDDKKMDFADFENIPPCQVGPHSDTNNAKVEFKSEVVTNVALTDDQAAAVKAQQQQSQTAGGDVDGAPRRNGPREFEEAQNLKQQEIVDGKANCRNFGCQQTFVVAENNDTACRYHSGGPVFHDTYKYWKCCPDQKKIDFDDFAAVPGCTTGAHKL